MLRLTLDTLRFRKLSFLATFIAMFCGAAIVMACGGLMETGIRANVPPQRLAAASVVVTGDQSYQASKGENAETATLTERVGIPTETVQKIQTVSGVQKAIGEVSFESTLLRNRQPVSANVQTLGHAWTSAELGNYQLQTGTLPAAGQIVLDADLAKRSETAIGERVEVVAQGITDTYQVSGIANSGHSSHTSAIFFSSVDAQNLNPRPGQVDAIGVLADPGVGARELQKRIKAALSDEPIVTLIGDERGLAEFPEVQENQEDLIALAGVFGGLAVFITMFVVSSTLALSIQQRQRELALLRAIGTTPGQVRRMVLGETMLVSTLATALAFLPGLVLGRWLFDQLADHDVVPAVVRFQQGWIPTVAAVGAALVTAMAAALITARRAAQTRPIEALMEAAVQRRWVSWPRILIAVVFLAGGVSLMLITALVMHGPLAASTAGPTVMAWAIGLALLSPGITKVMIVLLNRLFRVFGLAGYLAMLNARAKPIHIAAAVTPIMLAVAIATGNLYLQTTQVHAAQQAYIENLRADAVLTSTAGGIAPELIGQVRAVPGVAAASEFTASTVFVESPNDKDQGENGWQAQGVSAKGADQTIAVSVTEGDLTQLHGNTVALSARHARALKRDIGDMITMRLGDGATVEVRIVALFPAKPDYDPIFLPVELLAPHTTAGLPSQILVRAAPNTDAEQLHAALAKVASQQPGVLVADRDVVAETYADQQQTQAWVNYLLVSLIVGYTIISVVNTLVLATARRRREFGLQRLTGSTRGQVMQMMTVEALLTVVIGVILGTALAATSLIPFSLAVSDSAMPSGPLSIYLAIVGSALLLTLLATLLPTWQAMRPRAAEAAVAIE